MYLAETNKELNGVCSLKKGFRQITKKPGSPVLKIDDFKDGRQATSGKLWILLRQKNGLGKSKGLYCTSLSDWKERVSDAVAAKGNAKQQQAPLLDSALCFGVL